MIIRKFLFTYHNRNSQFDFYIYIFLNYNGWFESEETQKTIRVGI